MGTYGTLFKTLINKRSLTECYKYLRANPQEFKNLIKGFSDLIYFAFMTILFKSVLVPGFDAWYKDEAKKNIVLAGLSKGIFKGAQQSPSNFCGPFSVVSASGDISVPVYTYPVTELKICLLWQLIQTSQMILLSSSLYSHYQVFQQLVCSLRL